MTELTDEEVFATTPPPREMSDRDVFGPKGIAVPDGIPAAMEARLEAGNEARKREGGLLQTIPQGIEMISTPEGRTKLWEGIKKYPSKVIDDTINMGKLPGDVAAAKIDLTTEAGLDQAIGLGMLVAGSRLNKLTLTGKTSGLGVAMGEPVSRISKGPTGEIYDLPIGTAARSEDFVTAAQVVAGEDAPMAVQQKMLRAYEEKGLHPSELAHDAMSDPILAQELLSSKWIDAYHGSPHDFEAFHISKIGTGEGAQAYGHGLYFAQNESVARSYRDALGGDSATVAGKNYDPYNPVHAAAAQIEESGSRPAAIRDTESLIKTDTDPMQFSSRVLAILKADRELPPIEGGKGHMYQVRIKADPETFLNWDRPVTDQSMLDRVMAAANEIKPGWYDRMMGQGKDLARWALTESDTPKTGANIYGTLKRGLGSDAAASEALSRAGIPGIKYLDGGSRAAGDGTKNYVVFNHDGVEITHKNGSSVTAAERAEVLSGGDGKPPKPPPPPDPPEPGSFGEAQKKILDKISVGARPEKGGMTWDKFYTQAVDDLHPLKEVDKGAYDLARLTRGQFGKAEHFLEHGTFDFHTYKTNGKPLKEILAPVRNDLDGVRAFLASKRAVEIEASGRKSGMDLEAANRVIAEGEGKYGKIAEEVVTYQRNALQYLRDSGVLSDDAFNAMTEAGQSYVPFYRMIGEGEMGGGGAGKSFGPGNPVKRLKGSERDIIDPLESIIKNTYAYVSIAERNAVGIKLIDALKADGAEVKVSKPPRASTSTPPVPADHIRLYRGEGKHGVGALHPGSNMTGGWFTTDIAKARLYGEVKYVDVTKSDLRNFAQGHGGVDELVTDNPAFRSRLKSMKETTANGPDAELLNYLKEKGVTDPEAIVDFVKSAIPEEGGDTLGAFRNGVKETVKVNDPELVTAFRGIEQSSANMLFKVLAVPARALRAGAVLTPEFMTRNIVRDFMTAMVNSKGFFSPIDTAKGLVGYIRKDADFLDWLKGGGANSTMVALDRRYMQESLQKLNGETGLMDRAWNVVRHPISSALHPLRVTSELLENATRLGEFKKLTGPDKASIQQAALASREVTLDFARIGASMRAYNMITAFGNAQIQGLDRVGRAFAERPFNTMAKVAGGITLPSVLLWWANKDDQRVKDLPAWQKDLFWIVATKDHLYRIPKPFELGVVFGSGVERVLDATIGNNPEAFDKFSKSMFDILAPNVLPTATTPIVEQFANRSTFSDRTLIPQGMEKHLPEYQYTPYTTELSKKLGQVISAFPGMRASAVGPGAPFGPIARTVTSPILLENYIRAWSGGLGVYAMQAADLGLRKTGVLPDPAGPTPTLADIPVVKAFVVRYPSATTQSIQDFYDKHEVSKKFYDTWLSKAEEGDADAMARIQAAGGPMMFARLDAIKETLLDHNKLVRDIYKNPTIPPAEKRQHIDGLYFAMIEIGKGGKAMITEVEKAFKQGADATP